MYCILTIEITREILQILNFKERGAASSKNDILIIFFLNVYGNLN